MSCAKICGPPLPSDANDLRSEVVQVGLIFLDFLNINLQLRRLKNENED